MHPQVDQNIFYTWNIVSILVKRREICLKICACEIHFSESDNVYITRRFVFERTCLHLNINY